MRTGKRLEKFLDQRQSKLEHNMPFFGNPNTLIKNITSFTSEKNADDDEIVKLHQLSPNQSYISKIYAQIN